MQQRTSLETIALLRQNTPAYFDPSEEADFNHYLDVEREDYFVYEEEGRIVGAGGINYFPERKDRANILGYGRPGNAGQRHWEKVNAISDRPHPQRPQDRVYCRETSNWPMHSMKNGL